MTQPPKPSRSYGQVLQLNQELVQDLQGLIDDHERKMKQLTDLQAAHDEARGEIGRLKTELKGAQDREVDLHDQLTQLESQRQDQLAAVSAHLDALRSAIGRYLHQDQGSEPKAA